MENKIYGVTLKGSFDPMRINTYLQSMETIYRQHQLSDIGRGFLSSLSTPNPYKTKAFAALKAPQGFPTHPP
jgi:hypothetical protein